MGRLCKKGEHFVSSWVKNQAEREWDCCMWEMLSKAALGERPTPYQEVKRLVGEEPALSGDRLFMLSSLEV